MPDPVRRNVVAELQQQLHQERDKRLRAEQRSAGLLSALRRAQAAIAGLRAAALAAQVDAAEQPQSASFLEKFRPRSTT
jgi:hypothetical protein